MDIADMADKLIEDQVLTSIMRIRSQGNLTNASDGAFERPCEACGGAIAKARLKIVPGSTHCIQCATKQERERAGLFTRGDRHRINNELDDFLLIIS
ncbi:MAG: TraR/DksA C4-type zinc finger protein [Sedimenticola sp.]|nr:TraR/DksA C4-type zinc finger protein [Sedimenticola sp.]MCW8921458.1 TraR/DksA C4-type zinc finger protein [Sedimenticola sp.]MCW8976398.1 TraR/DksA C4-type zinc finger protein [Sedimenticola sp.]MDF1529892.1 TraR/DksA C4-type zinc finger protein [Sedimenticola sp.]